MMKALTARAAALVAAAAVALLFSPPPAVGQTPTGTLTGHSVATMLADYVRPTPATLRAAVQRAGLDRVTTLQDNVVVYPSGPNFGDQAATSRAGAPSSPYMG